jgi:hypothetical protein
LKTAKRLSLLAFMVVPIAVATGCGGGGQPPASKPATDAAPPAAAATASASSIGVPECDDYLAKVEACVANHVPEDARAMQRQSMDQMRSQWRQQAENPTAKAGLAAGCKAALDAARSSMATYGCEW